MKKYIFYTTEGFTFQPNSESDMPDVENCQILGWGKGNTSEEAFNDFKKENKLLEKSSFDEVICQELKSDKVFYFSLKFINKCKFKLV